MGCICSKERSDKDKVDEYEKEKELNESSVQLVAPVISAAEFGGGGGKDGLVPHMIKTSTQPQVILGPVQTLSEDKNNLKVNGGKPRKGHYQRCMTLGDGVGVGESKPLMTRLLSVSQCGGGNVDAGWPLWLSSVAGEAIKGWVPRRADTFEKLDQIGQGAYSSVHKARDLETGKIVALKKVRFVSTDAESVRFMAREIYILRQLDHPNVMKLEGIVTSRTSSSLYLVFEYMEHDLAGLAAIHGKKFTEPQIKCFMQQLLCALEHCHSLGVLHRDIKGSNLLVDSNGNLKIGDFGLATICEPEKKQPLTSRVVTLWYRAPELLLGATEYGAAIDLWSAGCILAELLIGKPIMPGRTEVEQMHKIFKLCGSPSEDYWQRTKFPHATSFKPQQCYKRHVAETFKNYPSSAVALVDKLLAIEPEERGSATSAVESEFFTTNPLPCDPSSLPKFSTSKEFDAKRQDKEARSKNAETVKGRGPVSVLRGAGDTKVLGTPEFNAQLKSNPKMSCHDIQFHEAGGVPPRNGYAHSTSVMHISAAAPSLDKRSDLLEYSYRKNPESRTQRFHVNHSTADFSESSIKKEQGMTGREPGMSYAPKKSRFHCSGPLVPPGGNIDDMLREHERLMQEAFRSVKQTNPTKQSCH